MIKLKNKDKVTIFGWIVLVIMLISIISIIFGAMYDSMTYVDLGFFGLLLVQIGIWYDKWRIRNENKRTEEDLQG